MDLSNLIERNAAFTPDKAATSFEGNILSYAAFSARIEQAARALNAEYGVSRGDRVAILSLNRPDYLVLLYACARLGAMLVPLNHARHAPIKFGTLKGKIRIADNFDDPLPDDVLDAFEKGGGPLSLKPRK